MRNAFVVIVSLYTGLVSGFIVPPSVPKHTSNNTKNSSVISDKIRDVGIKSTTFATKFVVLPKSRTDIDEKDLYEHATVKQNNQSERAFIYINQKYKKPSRSKFIKISALDSADLGRNLVALPVTLPSVVQTPCPSAFDSGHTNSYFQGYDFSDKQTQEMASYFPSPDIFRCNFNQNKKYKVTERVKTQVPTLNRPDERRDYFELLKPPILRPVNRVNTKAKYGDGANEFPSLSPPSIPYKDNLINKFNLKNQFLSKTKDVGDEMRKNYVFDRPYIHHPVFQNKDVRVEDVNFEGDFINEDDSHRIYENNPEEDKLLDKYLKDTLEEQAVTNDKVNIPRDCSYRDCILQSSKQYTNNGLLVKPDCKCERRLNIKQADPFLAKDRSLREELREETKHNETALSSEVNYYEELLNDDTNLMKLDEEVIRSPKFNVTSEH